MKKRTAVRIISFSLAAFLTTFGFLVITTKEKERFRLEIENNYSRTFEEFGAGINNISITLKKAKFVSTHKQINSMAAKLLTESELAKNALSQLPHAGELTSINKFLSQVGNYAMAVSQNAVSSGEISENDRKNIETLYNTAQKISNIVEETKTIYNTPEYWAKELDEKIKETLQGENLSAALDSIEDEFSDYPTLIYDGPYSDHILNSESELLKTANLVSESEALQKAAKIAECDEDVLEKDGETEGVIPSYRFSSQGVTVAISKSGGYGVYMRKERVVTESILSYEQAVEKAKRYLYRIDMNRFRETYYFTAEGICVVNFAYVDGQTICYPDLVKVGVAMDNGEIMFYEASGYISNHKERTFTTPKYTAQQARECVSKELTITGNSISLIPTDYGEERCYEIKCKSKDDEEVLLYINVDTLEEENILILIKSDGGTLTK